MNKKRLLIVLALMITCFLLAGCGRVPWIKSANDKDRQNIEYATDIFVRTINARDSDALYELFDEQYQNDDLYDRICSFNDDHGDLKEAYADFFNYNAERLSRNPYISYSGVDMWLVTDDNIYSIRSNFNITKDKEIDITNLWVITAKTEAKENENFEEKYHFTDDSAFEYANYYDSDYVGEYRFIDGAILSWDPKAPHIGFKDIDQEKWVGASVDDFKERYGSPGNEYHIMEDVPYDLYYDDSNGKYVRVSVNEDNIIESFYTVDKLGIKNTCIEEVPVK